MKASVVAPDWVVFAVNGLTGFLAWVLLVTGLPAAPGAILTILMVMDVISGLVKSYSLGIPISSRKLKVGILGKLLVVMTPLCIALAAAGTSLTLMPLALWSINILILGEALSFVSNTVTVVTGKEVPEVSAVAIIGNKLKQVLEAFMKEGSSKE